MRQRPGVVAHALHDERVKPVARPRIAAAQRLEHHERPPQLARVLHGPVEREVVARPARRNHPIQHVATVGPDRRAVHLADSDRHHCHYYTTRSRQGLATDWPRIAPSATRAPGGHENVCRPTDRSDCRPRHRTLTGQANGHISIFRPDSRDLALFGGGTRFDTYRDRSRRINGVRLTQAGAGIAVSRP